MPHPQARDPPLVRARGADRNRRFLTGGYRRVPGAGHAQLLGRLLRGSGCAARAGSGRGGARGLVQLRRRGGGASIPWVWQKTTPEEAIAVRERGSVAALRQRIGKLADSPGLVRVADLATRAAVNAPTEGRPLYAGLRALPVPAEPLARLWHAATLLREHRGDGHNAALLAHGIGGTVPRADRTLDGDEARAVRPASPPTQGPTGRSRRPVAQPRPRGRLRRINRRRSGDQGADRGAHRRTRGSGVRRTHTRRTRRADHRARTYRCCCMRRRPQADPVARTWDHPPLAMRRETITCASRAAGSSRGA